MNNKILKTILLFTILIFNISGLCFAKSITNNNSNNNNNKVEYNQIGDNKNEALVDVNTGLKTEKDSSDKGNFDIDKYDYDSYNVRDIILKKLDRLHEKGEFTDITEAQINQLSSEDLKNIEKEFIKENKNEMDYDEESAQVETANPVNYDKTVLELVKQKLKDNKIPLAAGGALGGGLIFLSSKLTNKERVDLLLSKETPYAKNIREKRTALMQFGGVKPENNTDILYMAMNDAEAVNKISKKDIIENIGELKSAVEKEIPTDCSNDIKELKQIKDETTIDNNIDNETNKSDINKKEEILEAYSKSSEMKKSCNKKLDDYLKEVTNMSFNDIKKLYNKTSNDLITKQYGSKLEDVLDEAENKIYLNPNGVTKK